MNNAVSTSVPHTNWFSSALLAAGLVFFSFAGDGAVAQDQGYWLLSKVHPATIKQRETSDGLTDVVKEGHDNHVENTVNFRKSEITTHTYFSPPPNSLIPGQKVTFHLSIRRVQNTFTCCFFGTQAYYIFGVAKDPTTPTSMMSGQINSSDRENVRDLSGVMTVPDLTHLPLAERAEKSLWLRIQINPPVYDKLYQYAWVGGPPLATAKTGDIDIPIAASPTPPDAVGPSDQPKQTTKSCPDNATQLQLQVCRHTAAQGATIRVPIHLLKSDDLANLNFDLRYDPSVAKPAGKAEKGPLLGGQVLLESNIGQAGLARIGFAGSAGVSGSGVLAWVPFTIVGAPGSHTALTVQDTAANTVSNARPSFALVSGEIAVVQGQSTSDGASAIPKPKTDPLPKPDTQSKPPEPVKVFTALDALKALQMSVGLLGPDMAYDLDKNGQITSNDARLILRGIVGR